MKPKNNRDTAEKLTVLVLDIFKIVIKSVVGLFHS